MDTTKKTARTVVGQVLIRDGHHVLANVKLVLGDFNEKPLLDARAEAVVLVRQTLYNAQKKGVHIRVRVGLTMARPDVVINNQRPFSRVRSFSR
jgi:hypothetical protein